MRQTYLVVLAITQLSGIEWDNEKGANISDDDPAQVAVWDAYVQVSFTRTVSLTRIRIIISNQQERSSAKPFRNRGWPPFEKMRELGPSKARGSRQFNAAFLNGQENGNADDIDGEDADDIDGQDADDMGENTDQGNPEDSQSVDVVMQHATPSSSLFATPVNSRSVCLCIYGLNISDQYHSHHQGFVVGL